MPDNHSKLIDPDAIGVMDANFIIWTVRSVYAPDVLEVSVSLPIGN